MTNSNQNESEAVDACDVIYRKCLEKYLDYRSALQALAVRVKIVITRRTLECEPRAQSQVEENRRRWTEMSVFLGAKV